jgi:hypothetical protein
VWTCGWSKDKRWHMTHGTADRPHRICDPHVSGTKQTTPPLATHALSPLSVLHTALYDGYGYKVRIRQRRLPRTYPWGRFRSRLARSRLAKASAHDATPSGKRVRQRSTCMGEAPAMWEAGAGAGASCKTERTASEWLRAVAGVVGAWRQVDEYGAMSRAAFGARVSLLSGPGWVNPVGESSRLREAYVVSQE